QRRSTLTRSKSSSVPALANPKSPADCILEELPCAASWRQSKPKSGRPNELTHPSRKLTKIHRSVQAGNRIPTLEGEIGTLSIEVDVQRSSLMQIVTPST